MTTGLLRRTNVASISKRMRLRRSFIWDPSLVLYLPLWNDKFISLDYNQHVCTNTGSVLVPNRGRTFDGIADLITVPDAVSLDITGTLTLEAWIKPSTIASAESHMMIIGKIDAYYIGLQQNTGKILFRVYPGAEWTTATTITSTISFTHLLATYNGANKQLYINGVHVEDDEGQVGAIDTSVENLFIGDAVAAALYSFPGILGEIRIYNRSLTAGERLRNYQVTKWRYQ